MSILRSKYEGLLAQGEYQKILNEIDNIVIYEKSYDTFIYLSLLKLEIYYQRRIYLKGLGLCNEVISQLKEYDLQSKIKVTHYKSLFLLNGNRGSEAFKIIEENYTELLKLANDNPDNYRIDLIQNRIIRSRYLYTKYEHDLALNYLNEAKHLLNDDDDIQLRYIIYSQLAINQTNLMKFHEALQILKQWKETPELNENKYLFTLTYSDESNVFSAMGEFAKALECLLKAEKLMKNYENIDLQWKILNVKGLYYQNQGEINQSKNCHKAMIQIAKELDSENILAIAYNNLANTYYLQGDPDLALEYLFYCLSINEKIGDLESISTSYNNIAVNYQLKGEYDFALDYLNKSLELDTKLNNERKIATSMVNIGQVYYLKGELDEAENYFFKCLPTDEKYGDSVDLSETIYNLFTVLIEKEEFDKAKLYYERLLNIDEQSQVKVINLRYRLATVEMLLLSKRAKNIAKAQDILTGIVEEDVSHFELYVQALYSLCDILLYELIQTNEDEILVEIKQLVEQLQKIADTQQSIVIFAETYLIKSRIALLELELDEAQKLLNEAEKLANEKKLNRLAIKISSHQDQLLDQKAVFAKYLKEDASLQERLDKVKLEELFSRSQIYKQIIQVPEVPVMFLIIKEGGTTLYKFSFSDSTNFNEELVAGLFSAIHTLSDEVFQTESSLQRIRHEDYTIILKSQGSLLISYVFKGQSYSAVQKLEKFVQTLMDSKTVWKAMNREVTHLTESEIIGMDLIVNNLFSAT